MATCKLGRNQGQHFGLELPVSKTVQEYRPAGSVPGRAALRAAPAGDGDVCVPQAAHCSTRPGCDMSALTHLRRWASQAGDKPVLPGRQYLLYLLLSERQL